MFETFIDTMEIVTYVVMLMGIWAVYEVMSSITKRWL